MRPKMMRDGHGLCNVSVEDVDRVIAHGSHCRILQ